MSDDAKTSPSKDSTEKATDAPKLTPDDLWQDVEDVDDNKHMTSSDYYWNSYAHFGIHEEMLKDEVRTSSYRNSILENKHLFKDKIVLDVGCGTGILSLFAIQAGAKHAYAIDCSDIADQARQIVEDNGMSDKVTVIKKKVEEVELPVDKVDIIVSEWMGYFLFYESMLSSVLFAREKWLAEGGMMFPDKLTLNVCAIEDAQYKNEKINFWTDVYGFRMTCIRDLAMREPVVDTVDSDQIVTDHCQLMSVNTETCTNKEVTDFTVPYKLTAAQDDYVHAIVAYFDTFFTHCHKQVYFSTGPEARYTHWKQTVFYIPEALAMCKGETLEGFLSCRQNKKNPRDLDIVLSFDFRGKHHSYVAKEKYWLR